MMTMPERDLKTFANWDDLICAALANRQLFYGAPLDMATAYPYRRVRVVRVYKNGKIRIDPMTCGSDHFTADAGHLLRFRYQDSK